MSEKTRNTLLSGSIKPQWLVTCLLCMLVLMLVTWWGVRSRLTRHSYGESMLVVYSKDLNIGEGWEGEAVEWQFEVINRTTRPIEILSWETGCSCTRVKPAAFVVKASQQVPVTALINLPLNSLSEATVEPFSVTIKPRINNPALDHNGWVITGGVRKLLTTLPTLSWPEALIAGGYFNKSHAELQFAVPVKFCSIDYDKRYINNAEVVSVDNSDSRFMVTANLKSDLQASDVFSSVKIIVKTLDDVELPPVSIPLTASIVNDVYVLPSVISFGILEVGQDAEQEFLVVSRTNTSFSVIDRGIPDLSNLKKEDHSDNVFKLHGPLHNQDNDTMSSRQTFRIDLKNAQTGMHMKIFKLRVKQGSAETYEIPIRATYSVVPKD